MLISLVWFKWCSYSYSLTLLHYQWRYDNLLWARSIIIAIWHFSTTMRNMGPKLDVPHTTLQWCHNELHDISNYRCLSCLFSRLFRLTSKTTSKPELLALGEWKTPVTGGVPSQRASNVETVYIWWRYHENSSISHLCEQGSIAKKLYKINRVLSELHCLSTEITNIFRNRNDTKAVVRNFQQQNPGMNTTSRADHW